MFKAGSSLPGIINGNVIVEQILKQNLAFERKFKPHRVYCRLVMVIVFARPDPSQDKVRFAMSEQRIVLPESTAPRTGNQI